MEKVKILFVIASLSGGGGERGTVNMLCSMDPNKYQIDLQMFENKGINLPDVPSFVNIRDPLFPNGMPSSKDMIITFLKKAQFSEVLKKCWLGFTKRRKPSRVRTYYAWQSLRQLCPKIDNDYDVAVSCMHGVPTYYICDCVKCEKKILWMRTDYGNIPQIKDELKYYEQAYKIVGVSETTKSSLEKAFPSLHNVITLPNIRRHEHLVSLSKEYYPTEYDDNEDFKLLSVGRLIPLKGFDMAIDAAKILKKKGLKFVWCIVGNGELRETLQKQIEQCGVSDCVYLVGEKPNPYPYFAQCDIVVQTSRYEGKSNVLIEAMTFEKPVVVTNYSTVKDQVTDSVNGLVTEMNWDAIADAVSRLADDIGLYTKLSDGAKKSDYDQTPILEQYDKLFQTIL